MKSYKARDITSAAILIMLLCINISESKSFGQRYSSNSRRVAPHYCGSRLVDALNFLCSAGIYEPRNCMLAHLYVCKGRPNAPLCRVDCGFGRGRTRRLAQLRSDEMAAFVEKMLERTRRTRNASPKPKRHIYSQCCVGKCSISDLRNYCIRG